LGTPSLGLFASGQFAHGADSPDNSAAYGLFYGGGTSAGCPVHRGRYHGGNLRAAMILMLVVNATGMRVSEAGETEGLDLHEHGISAYPEYQISPWATPSGMPKH
jgi:Amt family ammonium transporter